MFLLFSLSWANVDRLDIKRALHKTFRLIEFLLSVIEIIFSELRCPLWVDSFQIASLVATPLISDVTVTFNNWWTTSAVTSFNSNTKHKLLLTVVESDPEHVLA